MLHYFCVQGSQQLAGSLNLDFWTRTVFEQSHQESSVRQALVSLSSLHLDSTTTSNRGVTARDETLEQYGKALRMLQRRLLTPNTAASRAALICSILFYCFEATLGNSKAATLHLQGGLNTLASVRRRGVVDELDSMTLEFERLNLQATLFYDRPIPCLEGILYPYETSTVVEQPFHRLSDAHSSFINLMHRGWNLMCNNVMFKYSPVDQIPSFVLVEKQSIHDGLADWKVKFDDLRDKVSDADRDSADQGYQILLVHWELSNLLLDGSFLPHPCVWDEIPSPRAARTLALIEGILSKSSPPPDLLASTPLKRVVSSEMGVVAPLFALALKTADQDVSDRAFELLKSTRRREGLWDAEHMASLIEKLRDARELKFGPLGEEALAEAKMMSLEMLFHEQFGGPISEAVDLNSTEFEQVVVALYGTFQPAGTMLT